MYICGVLVYCILDIAVAYAIVSVFVFTVHISLHASLQNHDFLGLEFKTSQVLKAKTYIAIGPRRLHAGKRDSGKRKRYFNKKEEDRDTKAKGVASLQRLKAQRTFIYNSMIRSPNRCESLSPT